MYFVILIIFLCGLSEVRNLRRSDKVGRDARVTNNYKDDISGYLDTTKDISTSKISMVIQDFEWSIKQDKPEKKNVFGTLNRPTMDNFWSMYHNGTLQGASETRFKMRGSFWRTLQSQVGPGSIVEIGGCQTSFDASADTNKTVLTLLTDSQTERSYTECSIPPAEKNLFLGRTSVENIITWTQKLRTYPIVFDNVILNKVSSLSENLLPHEFIEVLVRIFSVSRQIFLVDSSIDSLMQSYFKAHWPTPKELVEEVCKAGNLMCEGVKKSVWWNEERLVLKVTMHTEGHQRKLDPQFCLQYQQDEECYLKYILNKTKVINHQNDVIIENINDNHIPLGIIPYHTVISDRSLQDLLMKLLKDNELSDNYMRNILLDGERVTHQPIWTGDTQQVRTVDEKMEKSYEAPFKDITDTILTPEEKQVQTGLLYLTQSFPNPTIKTPRSLSIFQGIQPVTRKPKNDLKVKNGIYDKFPRQSKFKNVQEYKVSKFIENVSSTVPLKNIEPKLKDKRNVILSVLKKKDLLREKVKNTTQAPSPVFKKRKLLAIAKDTKESIKSYLKSHKMGRKDFSYKSQRNRKVFKNRNPQNSENIFDKLWAMMRLKIPNILGHNTQSNVIVYGGEEAYCLLSCKMAMMYPLASIITILPQQDTFQKCLKMVDTLPHKSNLLFETKLDSSLVNQISSLPQMFDLQILGMDILTNIITSGHGFLLYLGKLLTQAKTTILELPPFYQLQNALDIVAKFQTIGGANKTGNIFSIQGMIHQALQIVQADCYPVQILNLNSRSYNNRIILIQLKSFNKKITVNCKSKDSSIMKYNVNSGVYINQHMFIPGISLQYLLTLNLHPVARSYLFKEYLKLPIIKDMCPINIMWSNQTLMHRHLQLQVDDISNIQQGIDELKSEIKDDHFLFLDINNHDNIVTSLGQDYQNSTFISMRNDQIMGEKLYNKTREIGINNIAVTTQVLDDEFTDKLLHSPDIFRYSYLGYKEFLENLMEQNKEDFDSILGNLLSTSITSFIAIPSSQIISLATVTFYPDYFTSSVDQSMYLSTNHPLTQFTDIETDIIYESAKAQVEINIKTEIISRLNNHKNNILLPWKLVRIDIQHLNVMVGHHFDYELDGHKRKYQQHVKSENKTHYNVYLVRNSDNFVIPFGNVNAITLIALIRMGLIEQQKELFYQKFLHLPVYEDMATWNIVFRHGNLEYIDFDTRNIFYDKLIPSAAKIMAALDNYKRTLVDLNKCNYKAKNSLGFPFISECVGSEFEGPCNDLAYPVPCGDHTCRSTYIDCLQALLTNHPEAKEKSRKQSKPLQWSFNKIGAIKRETELTENGK